MKVQPGLGGLIPIMLQCQIRLVCKGAQCTVSTLSRSCLTILMHAKASDCTVKLLLCGFFLWFLMPVCFSFAVHSCLSQSCPFNPFTHSVIHAALTFTRNHSTHATPPSSLSHMYTLPLDNRGNRPYSHSMWAPNVPCRGRCFSIITASSSSPSSPP